MKITIAELKKIIRESLEDDEFGELNFDSNAGKHDWLLDDDTEDYMGDCQNCGSSEPCPCPSEPYFPQKMDEADVDLWDPNPEKDKFLDPNKRALRGTPQAKQGCKPGEVWNNATGQCVSLRGRKIS